jgi:hypothetical protein
MLDGQNHAEYARSFYHTTEPIPYYVDAFDYDARQAYYNERAEKFSYMADLTGDLTVRFYADFAAADAADERGELYRFDHPDLD